MFKVIYKDDGETYQVYDVMYGGFKLDNLGNGMMYTGNDFLVYMDGYFQWVDMGRFKPLDF